MGVGGGMGVGGVRMGGMGVRNGGWEWRWGVGDESGGWENGRNEELEN